MPHALTAHHAFGNELTVFIHRHFAAAHTLQLAIVRVDIFDWAKNTLTKQAIALWLLGAVVDCLWLGYFAVAPFQDVFRAGNR